jgi:hypothetical protein
VIFVVDGDLTASEAAALRELVRPRSGRCCWC